MPIELNLEMMGEIERCIPLMQAISKNEAICLVGGYGAGKDVWAKILKQYLISIDKDSEIIAFADPLRDSFIRAGFTLGEIDQLKRKDKKLNFLRVDGVDVTGLTMREALIKVAETKKLETPNYYANIAINRILQARESNKIPILTDLRFDVEKVELLENQINFREIKIPEDLAKIEVI